MTIEDTFVFPGPVSTAVFTGIVLAVMAAFVVGIRATTPRWTAGAVAGSAVWLAGTGAYTALGATHTIPGFLGLAAGSMLAAIALAASPLGAKLSELPIAALIGFQAFRLPLEIVLHSWHEQSTLPVQMTWEGQNFDVVAGIAALVVAAIPNRPRWLVWAFEGLGLVLLLNVMRVALASSPTPLRTFLDAPPVLVALHLPYAWIVPVCVAGALAGHLVLLRRLLRG